jgi:hypothetical protein
VQLGATLYNRFYDNYINHAGGVGIRGVEADYDAYYYGVNASWFRNNNIFGTGTAAQLHGIFDFSFNDVESGGFTAAKLIIGDTESASTAPLATVRGNYFEGALDAAIPAAVPIIDIQSDQGVSIEENVFFSNSATNSQFADFAGVQAAKIQSHGRVNNNYFNFANFSSQVGTAIDWKTVADCYFEAVANSWPTNTDNRIKVNGNDMKTRASSGPSFPKRRIYIRDRVHGEVLENMQRRHVWTTYTGSQVAAIRAEAGPNHVIIGWDSITPVAVENASDWPGARIVIHAKVTVDLTNAEFNMANGAATVTLPAGRIMEFMIDMDGTVREIGNYSASL